MADQHLWSVIVAKNNDLMVVGFDASVFSLRPDTAWRGVRIKIHNCGDCSQESVDYFREHISDATNVFLSRRDLCDNIVENWQVEPTKIYDVESKAETIQFSLEGRFHQMNKEVHNGTVQRLQECQSR